MFPILSKIRRASFANISLRLSFNRTILSRIRISIIEQKVETQKEWFSEKNQLYYFQ